MKKIFQLTLGIITSVGGFLEIGSVTTSVQAGAQFGYKLLWPIFFGTICLIFLIEMSGRLAAVSRHTIVDAMRERFGFPFFFVVLVGIAIVAFMVLVAELGGIGFALQILTGIGFPWWALPVSFIVWLLMWKGSFSLIENGASLLGLITISFVVAAIKLHPDWSGVASGLLPKMPQSDKARYGFLTVSILGATISPYLMYFYSSGAIEDKWDRSYIVMNRIIAGVWMLFACFGAALEFSLAIAYFFAQGFGWNWSEDLEPSKDSRFAFVYTLIIMLAAVPLMVGFDPVKVTMISMALTSATLPLAIVPFLFLMNDPIYLGKYRNGWLSNSIVSIVIVISFVLALISIPLQLIGG